MQNHTKTLPKQILLYGEEKLTSSRLDSRSESHANPSVTPEREAAVTTTVISGRLLSAQLKKSGHASLFLKTLLDCSQFYNQIVSLKWKIKRYSFFVRTKHIRSQTQSSEFSEELLEQSLKKPGQKDIRLPNIPTERQSFYVFQLVPSVRHTEGIESGLLLKTPSAMDGQTTGVKKTQVFGSSGTLSQEIESGFIQKRMAPTITTSMAMIQDFVQAGFHSSKRPKYSESLLLPTPTTMDWKDTGKMENVDENALLGRVLVKRHGLKLRVGFAAWMMMYPEDWTLIPFQKQSGEKKV